MPDAYVATSAQVPSEPTSPVLVVQEQPVYATAAFAGAARGWVRMQFAQPPDNLVRFVQAGSAAALHPLLPTLPHAVVSNVIRLEKNTALLTKHARHCFQEHSSREEVHGRDRGRDDCAFWRNSVPRLYNTR